MRKHAILTAIGLAIGILAVAWVQPNSAGATFLVALMIVIVNAIGAAMPSAKRQDAKPVRRPKRLRPPAAAK